MATKQINGVRTEAVEISGSGDTWILGKNGHLVSIDYGFHVAATANNTVIDIRGSLVAQQAVLGEADKLTVKIGAGADVSSILGVNMVGTKELNIDIDGVLSAYQFGIVSVAEDMKVDVGKAGSIGSGVYGIYSVGAGKFTANIDGKVDGGQFAISTAAKNGTLTVGKEGVVESGAYGIYSTGTGKFTATIDGEVDGGQYAILTVAGNSSFTVGKDGSVEAGVYGIYSVGANRFAVKVDGDVHGGQMGIYGAAKNMLVDVGKGGAIESGAVGINSVGTGKFTANIDGDVFSGQAGIMSAAEKGKIEIGKGAALDGGVYGLYMPNSIDVTVVNRGTITGAAAVGIGLNAGADVRNFGEINGMAGISAVGDKSQVVNEAGAEIRGVTNGITIQTAVGESSKIVNHGLIVTSDAGAALTVGDGNDRISNDGHIYGLIMANGGDDRIDLRGGTVKGQIYGGSGDDVLITDKASHKLVEGAAGGDDAVLSSVSYKLSDEVERLTLTGSKNIDGTGNDTANILRGNKGDNVLKGMAGMDELYGGKGDDRLIGGDDADIFHFSKGDGNDTITDLVTGVDDVDLSGWNAIQTFNQLMNHAKNDGDGNVVITSGNDSLTIIGMVKGDLDVNDFAF